MRAQSGATTEWSYIGEQHDPTGLEYLRARYYDVSTGRFVSRDPLPLLQRYAYAGNNPALLVDPTGLCCDPFKKVKHVAGSVASAVDDMVGTAVEYGIDNYCQFSPSGPLTCLELQVLDIAATKVACLSGKEGYFDLNYFNGGVGPTVGAQVSCKDGLHPYVGLAAGTPNLSLTMGPGQSITEGGVCGGGAAIPVLGTNLSVQWGWGGLLQFGSDGVGSNPTEFREVGASNGGVGGNCAYVLPNP